MEVLQENEEKGELDLQGTVCLILHRKLFLNIMLLIFVSVCVLNALLNEPIDEDSRKLCICYCTIVSEHFVSIINISCCIYVNAENYDTLRICAKYI